MHQQDKNRDAHRPRQQNHHRSISIEFIFDYYILYYYDYFRLCANLQLVVRFGCENPFYSLRCGIVSTLMSWFRTSGDALILIIGRVSVTGGSRRDDLTETSRVIYCVNWCDTNWTRTQKLWWATTIKVERCFHAGA